MNEHHVSDCAEADTGVGDMLARRAADLQGLVHQLLDDPASARKRRRLQRRLHALGLAARAVGCTAVAQRLLDCQSVLEAGGCTVDSLLELSEALEEIEDAVEEPDPPVDMPFDLSTPATTRLKVCLVGGGWMDALLRDRPRAAETERTSFDCLRFDSPFALPLDLGAYPPDLFVIDFDLAGAPTLIDLIRDDPRIDMVPVVALTASPEYEGESPGEERGPFGATHTFSRAGDPEVLRAACIQAVQDRRGPTVPMKMPPCLPAPPTVIALLPPSHAPSHAPPTPPPTRLDAEPVDVEVEVWDVVPERSARPSPIEAVLDTAPPPRVVIRDFVVEMAPRTESPVEVRLPPSGATSQCDPPAPVLAVEPRPAPALRESPDTNADRKPAENRPDKADKHDVRMLQAPRSLTPPAPPVAPPAPLPDVPQPGLRRDRPAAETPPPAPTAPVHYSIPTHAPVALPPSIPSRRPRALTAAALLVAAAALGVGARWGAGKWRHPVATPVATHLAQAGAADPTASPAGSSGLLPPEGLLQVSADDKSVVLVDGTERGHGPALSITLPVGFHELKGDGPGDKARIVEIVRGRVTHVDLARASGTTARR
jgi:hypothetical protein